MTDTNSVKRPSRLSTELAAKTPGSQGTKYMLGDGVVALWSSDGRWRKGIIQQIVDDEAVVICLEESFLQPTRVKMASLMPDVNLHVLKSSDGDNRRDPCISSSAMETAKSGGQMEEVFCHKDVETFMENNSEIFQHSGDIKEASKILSRVGLSDNSSPSIRSENFRMESSQEALAGRSGAAGINENVVASFIESQANSISSNSSPSCGNLATMARTGRGSRYLQSLLVTTPASVPQIFCEIMGESVSAMTHPKACFVVQKLLEVANPEAVNHMVQEIADNFAFLSLNPYGCHVVQKALTVAPNPLMMVIQLENYRDLMTMLRSPHGTHVAQACLPLLPPRTNTFIINAVAGQVVDLGRNQHGTYFLQKMVEIGASHGEGIDGNVIVMEILKHIGALAHNQNGTWLVQSVLKCGDVVIRRVAHWVLENLLTIYKSQPAMFLALALVQKLREKCKVSQSWASLLGDLVIGMVDHQVAGRPLLVAAAVHQIGHLLAREVARQVMYLGHGRPRDRVVEVVTRYKDILGSNSYGNLVLKGLHEASSCYNVNMPTRN